MGLKSVWPDGMAYFPMMFKVIRAYFYGWGVPVDLEKAQPFVKKMEFSYGILWGDLDVRTVDKTDPAKRHLWVDAQALQAEMRALGFGKSNGMNIFKFNFRPQDNEMAVVISDKIMEKASQMRNSAKALIADAVAEFNGIEHAERRANRS
jgi:hypothetical protein